MKLKRMLSLFLLIALGLSALWSSPIQAMEGTGTESELAVQEEALVSTDEVQEELLPPSDISQEELAEDDFSENIIGEDNRVKIADTTIAPYRQVVRLYMYYDNEQSVTVGSGTMVGPDTVLTAAHNVYTNGKWADKVRVIPAMNGEHNYPYESYTSRHYYMLKGYLANDVQEQSKYDTAVIKLPSPVHPEIGQLSVSTAVKDDEPIQVVGYPGVQLDKSGYMYAMSGNVYFAKEDTVDYLIDTEGGQSGSPVLNQHNQIVGVHTRGSRRNIARRVKEDTVRMIEIAQGKKLLTDTDEVVSNRAGEPEALQPLQLKVPHHVIDDKTFGTVLEVLKEEEYTIQPGASILIPAIQQPHLTFLNDTSVPNALRVYYDDVLKNNSPRTMFYSRPIASSNQEPKQPKQPADPQVNPAPSGSDVTTTTTATVTTTTKPTTKLTTKSTTKPSTKPAPKPKPALKPTTVKSVYRLHNAKTKKYFYTIHTSERDKLVKQGWKMEGVAWKAETKTGEPVYRLQNLKTKEYFYTKNRSEYDKLGKQGWKKEGTAFRSHGSVAVYRLHHAKTKEYFFTRHTSERDKLVGYGWKAEGIAWMSQP